MSDKKTDNEAARLFREAVGDARPLELDTVDPYIEKPPPKAKFRAADEARVLAESLSASAQELENNSGERLRYRRNEIPERVLKRLGRGHYRIESEIDLHGMTRDQARAALREFLNICVRDNLRCIRIVHGKGRGSGPRGPVLKKLINSWLRKTELVLAFISAPALDGGTGAVYVLLNSS